MMDPDGRRKRHLADVALRINAQATRIIQSCPQTDGTEHRSKVMTLVRYIGGTFFEVKLEPGQAYCQNCGNVYSISLVHRCCDHAIVPQHLRAYATEP
jgi:hypothetical protein